MIPGESTNEPLRLSLVTANTSRDGTRAKGSWGVNVFHDSGRIRKRFGLTLDTSGAALQTWMQARTGNGTEHRASCARARPLAAASRHVAEGAS